MLKTKVICFCIFDMIIIMNEHFVEMLTVGGKTNSLGRTSEVITLVLNDKIRLNELYECLFDEDAWVRMRAADALEKICREQPEWLEPFIDKIQISLFRSTQASIQWHLAQIYRKVSLTKKQTHHNNKILFQQKQLLKQRVQIHSSQLL